MRRFVRSTTFAALGLASLALAPVGCETSYSNEKVVRQAQPIQGGSVDQTDTNVVVILINSAQGLSLCSGSLVAENLVLSAHHCVADVTGSGSCGGNSFGSLYAASSFVVSTSYDAAAAVFNGGGFPSPDGQTWFGVKSVAVPGQDICGQDLSALTLSQPIQNVCPLIPTVDTDVKDGEPYTAVGFGITNPNGQVAGTRYTVAGQTVQCAEDCNDPQMSASGEWEGGASSQIGTCEGDSGGPALDSSGRVIGSVSRGPANACNQTVYESYYGAATWIKQVAAAAATAGGYAPAGWVTGGATSNPANGYCGGSSSSGSSSGSGSGSSSGSSSSGSSSGGSSGSSGSSSSGGSSSSSSGGTSSSSSGGSGSTSSGSSSGGSSSSGSSSGTSSGGGEVDGGASDNLDWNPSRTSSGCTVAYGASDEGALGSLAFAGLIVLGGRRRSRRG